MANKLGTISYTLATIASICFVSGLLVLTGGDSNADGEIREVRVNSGENN